MQYFINNAEMKKHYGYVYKTTCLKNGKQYIGCRSIQDGKHNYYGSSNELKEDINKYGIEQFTVELIEFADTRQELADKELYYIQHYKADTSKNFYNKKCASIQVASNTFATRDKQYKPGSLYEDVKDKLRTNNRANKSLDITNGNYGNFWTTEKKQRLSKYFQSINHSKGENNPMYGKKGEDAINGQKIVMCDLRGNPIRLFVTKRLAMEFLNIGHHTQLNKALVSGKPYKNYIWKSANEFNIDYEKLKQNNWMF